MPEVQEAVAVFEPLVLARSGGASGARRQRALRVRAEFLQQAVECLAVRDAESRGLHARTDCRERPLARGQVDPEPAGDDGEKHQRAPGRIPLRRGDPRPARLYVERVLRLVRRDAETAAARPGAAASGPAAVGGRARRPAPPALAVHAIYLRRALAATGRNRA